jgi:hypothetical protein
MESKYQNMASGVVNGLASFGRFEATLQLGILTVIALCCCASGIMTLKSPDPKSKTNALALFAGGLCVFLLGIAVYMFAQSSQTGAAVMGGVGAFNIAESVI